MSCAWLLAEMAGPVGSEALDLSVLGRLVVVVALLLVGALLVLADLVVEAPRLPAVAEVVEAAQLLQVLSSRQSFSASTARISPSQVQPTYERAPSTR